MTPQDLVKAWPDGVPGAGTLTLTLDPRAAAQPIVLEIIAERFSGLARALTATYTRFEPDFAITLRSTILNGTRWDVNFAFSYPATDVMTHLLNALHSIAADAGGDLFTDVNVTAAPNSALAHRMILPETLPTKVVNEDRIPLEPASLATLLGASVYAIVPPQSSQSYDTHLDAVIALSALVEEGCFGLSNKENDLSSPIVGSNEAGTETHIGVTGFRGDLALCNVLAAMSQRMFGLPNPPTIVIAHEDLF